MKIHELYIKRCIEIAKNGLGTTAPNPMVGSVIVYQNKIIGEGYTQPYGNAHAEVIAIRSVKDKKLLTKATLYVTLEPCSHFGKTPPCCDLIVKHKIPNIIIGTIDTHSKVAGKGIEKLKANNCNVIVGVLEDQCKAHHKRFFTFHNKKRPYIILKWAETSSGFIAPKQQDQQCPVWISNPISRQLVHKWRAEEQAILVGTTTVLKDNPALTTRDWKGKNPVRVVIDKSKVLPKKLTVFNNAAPTVILTKDNINFNTNTVQQICNILFEANMTSFIVEGGAKTLQRFIDENLWDEARVCIGRTEIKDGIKAPILKGVKTHEKHILKDIIKTYNNV